MREKNLLLVDDYDVFLDIASDLLCGMQYRVFKFLSAVEALENLPLVGSSFYDVVITDYDMPVINGFELKNELRAAGVLCPIVLWSGHVGDIITQSSMGFSLELPKSIDAVRLEEALLTLF